jgi:hypothetical protein
MHDAKNRVGANKIPRIDRSALMRWVALELVRIDRCDSAVRTVWRSAVLLGLVDIDSLVEFGGRAGRRRAWRAKVRRSGNAVAVVVAGGSSERS